MGKGLELISAFEALIFKGLTRTSGNGHRFDHLAAELL